MVAEPLRGTLSLVTKVKKWQVCDRGRQESTAPLPRSAFGKEFVLFNHGGDCHLAIRAALLNPHDASFALYANALGKRDFGRERKRKANRRSLRDRRIQIQADSARANVADLRGFGELCVFLTRDGDWDPEREAACSPFFLLGFCHALPQANEVACCYALE